MRYLESLVVAIFWMIFVQTTGVEISTDMKILTLAIVFAGTMAGGD